MAEETRGSFERFGELRVFRGVFRGKPGNSSGSRGGVVVEQERFAIGRGSKNARIGLQDFTAELFELQVFGDVSTQRAQGVRERGGVEAGMKFLGDCTATDDLAAFENDGLEAALGEVKSSDESVVSAADESYALSDGHD